MTKSKFLLNAVAFVVAVVVLPFLLAWDSFGCPAGSTEYEGVCAANLQAEKVVQTFVPSDEKPPSDKMPSYQREGVHADMPESTGCQDAKADSDKAQADGAGKRAAGL